MTWPLLIFRACTSDGMYISCCGPSMSAIWYEAVFAVVPDEQAFALAGSRPAPEPASADAATSSALSTTRRTRMATSLLSPNGSSHCPPGERPPRPYPR